MANEFNNFFVNVASKIKEPVINTYHDILRKFCHEKLPEGKKFVIPSLQKEKVSKFSLILTSIKQQVLIW